MIASLLISDSPAELRVAGKILEEEINPNVDLIDLAAMKLLINHEKTDSYNVDANAWLIKAIKHSGYKRYLPLFNDIRNKSNIEKIQKYLDKAIPSLTKGNNSYFNVSEYNFDEVSSTILTKAATSNFPYSHIDSVAKGEDIEEIYKRLGYPSRVSYYINSKWMPFVGKVKLEDAKLIYQGSGDIQLVNRGGKQIVHAAIPEKMFTIADNLNQDLVNANGTRTIILAKTLYKNKDYSEDLLDSAADKIWAERKNKDVSMIDGVAWLCKYLGQSKNSRYYSFLKKLIDSNDNKKIIKYAKSSIKFISNNGQITDSYTPSEQTH